MPERPVPPPNKRSLIGVPAHRPLDTIGNLQAIQKSMNLPPASSVLDPSNLIRTAPQQNYGIPTQSSIRPMTAEDYTRQPGTQSAIDMAAGFAMPTVYHGSPHLFDMFDMSKIGTGEGAQVYGHGLYFAENPKVARTYQMTAPREVLFDRAPISTDARFWHTTAEGVAKRKVEQYASINDAMNEMKEARDAWAAPPKHNDNFKMYEEALNWLKENQHRFEIKHAGGFYETHIPDEIADKMLHWDKQLDQQNPQIHAAIDQLIDDFELNRVPKGWFSKDWSTGSSLYKRLSQSPVIDQTGAFIERLGDKRASAELAKRGIPGIQYFDQMSRSAQKGTRNFVVFDTSILGPVKRK